MNRKRSGSVKQIRDNFCKIPFCPTVLISVYVKIRPKEAYVGKKDFNSREDLPLDVLFSPSSNTKTRPISQDV